MTAMFIIGIALAACFPVMSVVSIRRLNRSVRVGTPHSDERIRAVGNGQTIMFLAFVLGGLGAFLIFLYWIGN